MTARSTSRSRASCCCPCGLAPVVTVVAGTTWGDATPCYSSHHTMLVLLYGLAHNTYPTLKPRLVFSTLKPRLVEHAHTRTDFLADGFFFWDVPLVGIRNSLRSNKKCFPGIYMGGHYGFLLLKNNPRVTNRRSPCFTPGIYTWYQFLVYE